MNKAVRLAFLPSARSSVTRSPGLFMSLEFKAMEKFGTWLQEVMP